MSPIMFPFLTGMVPPLVKVTAVSAVASGVAVAPEVAPVTAFAPLKAT